MAKRLERLSKYDTVHKRSVPFTVGNFYKTFTKIRQKQKVHYFYSHGAYILKN